MSGLFHWLCCLFGRHEYVAEYLDRDYYLAVHYRSGAVSYKYGPDKRVSCKWCGRCECSY